MNTSRRLFFRGAGRALVAGAAMAGSVAATASAPAPEERKLLHIEVGDDNWQPTPEELTEIVQEFQAADADPLGAVLATRRGVRVTRI